MRNINQELQKFTPALVKKQNEFAKKQILKSRYPFVVCAECGKKMLNDQGMIQKHFLKEHIRDRVNNGDKGFRFHPVPQE